MSVSCRVGGNVSVVFCCRNQHKGICELNLVRKRTFGWKTGLSLEDVEGSRMGGRGMGLPRGRMEISAKIPKIVAGTRATLVDGELFNMILHNGKSKFWYTTTRPAPKSFYMYNHDGFTRAIYIHTLYVSKKVHFRSKSTGTFFLLFPWFFISLLRPTVIAHNRFPQANIKCAQEF